MFCADTVINFDIVVLLIKVNDDGAASPWLAR
jgi:hypothetical protein